MTKGTTLTGPKIGDVVFPITPTSIDGMEIGEEFPANATFIDATVNGSTVLTGPVSGAGFVAAVEEISGGSSYDPSNVAITGGAINGTSVGFTTAATGRFSTLTATSAIIPSTTQGIIGTIVGDDALPGSIGEYIFASAQNVSLNGSTFINVATIALTPGDWDVSAGANFNIASAVATAAAVVIQSTAEGPYLGPPYSASIGATLTGNNLALTPPTRRINITQNTDYHIVMYLDLSGTATGTAFIGARRRR